MGLIDDPISGVVGLFFKRAINSKIAQRATLLLEMVIAGTIAYLAASGIAILSGQSELWATGVGRIAEAIALLATFQVSPNSKGLIISLPSQAAEKELTTPISTIERK